MSSSETSTAATPSPDHRAPLILWRAAQAFLGVLFDLFGAPEQLAARHTLTLKDHQICSQWLRAAEALMRRMLFIEAALIAAERGPPGPLIVEQRVAPTIRALRSRQLIGIDADQPQAWRVSFKCVTALDRRRPRRRLLGVDETPPARTPAVHLVPKFRSAWPLAERQEALLRVCNNPAPYAKRLAARLRKTPVLVTRLCASAWSEFRDLIGHTLHDALIHPIACAAAVFRDSS